MAGTGLHSRRAARAGVLGLALVAAGLAACGGREEWRRGADRGAGADVAISTPIGALSVRTGAATPDTGLPVYPGATPARERGEGQSADVNIDTPIFGLQVAAAKFEVGDGPSRVLAFYRTELARYGEVTECRGNIDFDRRGGPRCRSREGRDVHLVVGDEDRHRMVAVSPRGDGTEFALVRVTTRGD